MVIYCVELGRLQNYPDYIGWLTTRESAERVYDGRVRRLQSSDGWDTDEYVRLVEVELCDLGPLCGSDPADAASLVCDILNRHKSVMTRTELKRTVRDRQPAAV